MELSFADILDRNFPIISDEYKVFAEEKSKCRACSMYSHYETIVQSEGNAKNPTFMFIGEAAGKEEIKQNRPFVGNAGQRLRIELRKYPETFRKDTVLISNVLSCRPQNNKFPASDHSNIVETCCNLWVRREINILKPKIIVTLGNPALKYIRGDWGITAHRGQWKFIYRYRSWSFATFHPSYVIRSEKSGREFVADNFEEDIEKIATSWRSIVDNDDRMSLSQEEWEHQLAIQSTVELGLKSS